MTEIAAHDTESNFSSGFINFVSTASFWTPELTVPDSAWLEHAPFAYWLIGVLRPRIFVELGTQSGFSYFCFCQAVQRLKAQTECHAIDTWKGDEHTGFYGEEVFAEVRKHNEHQFSAFSTLIRSTFDEAVGYFIDNTVDLLHIDGRHFYDDVRSDFERWRCKLSDRAVVIFHDTNVRERGFGVFKLWNELSQSHPHFEFTHGNGLGVMGIGDALPQKIKDLFSTSVDAATKCQIQRVYGRLGAAVAFQAKSQFVDIVERQARTLKGALLDQESAAATLNQSLTQRINEVEVLRQALSERDVKTSLLNQALIAAREQETAVIERLGFARAEREELNRTLSSVRAQLSSATTELSSARAQLSSARAELSSVRAQLAEQQELAAGQHRNFEGILNNLQHSLDIIRNSTSWRMTGPLRVLLSRVPFSARRLLRRIVRTLYWAATPWRMPTRIVVLRARVIAKRKQLRNDHGKSQLENTTDYETSAGPRYQIEYYARTHVISKKRVIICLTHELPWPPQQGNQYRIMRMVNWLSHKGYEVVIFVVPMSDVPLDNKKRDAAFERYPNVLVCYRNGLVQASFKSINLSLDLLQGHFVGEIVERSVGISDPVAAHAVEHLYCHDTLIGVAVELAKQMPSAIWYLNYAFMTRVLNYVPTSMVSFVDTIDIFSQKAEKVLAYGVEGEVMMSADEESRLLGRADALLAIQDDDANALRRLVPGKPVITVGVDFESAPVGGRPTTATILMVANDNALNTKGITDFLRFAWPKVKASITDVELVLVGSIGRVVRTDDRQVIVAGIVDLLTPYYEQARVVINPAVAGTGLKIKTVESIAHLRPIVTWPNGADGIAEPLIRFCHVAKDWYEFGDKVISLLADQVDETVDTMKERAAIQAALSADAVYRGLDSWLSLCEKPKRRRLDVPPPNYDASSISLT
jgi:hypothetical protein